MPVPAEAASLPLPAQAGAGPRQAGPAQPAQAPAAVGAVPLRPAARPAAAEPSTDEPAATEPTTTGPATTGPATTGPATTGPATTGPATTGPATTGPATTEPAAASLAGQSAPAEPSQPVPSPRPAPQVRIVAAGPAPARPARQVERVLGGPAGQRSTSWRDHVTVVPGGRGPGQPDQVKRERVRATAALDGPRLVVVLGCTVGAGQTVTALMLADLLAKLRAEPVAAVDLNPGPASLAEQVQTPPAATVAALLAGRDAGRPAPHFGGRGRGRLDVIAQDLPPGGPQPAGEQDHQRLYGILAGRYPLVVVDPGAMAVARALAAADQLILVAPASPDAARATAMTLEWLDGNGYTALISGAVAVMNGVSKRSATHAEQAEGVVRGRCRAIVRVPWDDHLGAPSAEQGLRGLQAGPGSGSRLDQLRPPVLDAYTALAGVLISGLAAAPANGKAAP